MLAFYEYSVCKSLIAFKKNVFVTAWEVIGMLFDIWVVLYRNYLDMYTWTRPITVFTPEQKWGRAHRFRSSCATSTSPKKRTVSRDKCCTFDITMKVQLRTKMFQQWCWSCFWLKVGDVLVNDLNILEHL
jgi:hypothetical protein